MTTTSSIGRILVVDDDREVRALLGKLLRSSAIPFELCSSSAAAKEILKRNGVSMALIDLAMPDEGGESLIEWIENNAPHVRPVVLTGNHARAEDLAAYSAVLKPFDSKGIIDFLRFLMHQIHTDQKFAKQDDLLNRSVSDIKAELKAIRDNMTPSGILAPYFKDRALMIVFGAGAALLGALLKKLGWL